MATSEYLERLRSILQEYRHGLTDSQRFDYKNSFGAVAGYIDGQIFIVCGKFGLALKLPSEILTDLLREAEVQKLRYFPNGHVKKDYAVIPPRLQNDRDRFGSLLSQSIDFALQSRRGS